jgi:hypothetical protein
VTGTPHANLTLETQAPIVASSHGTWPLDDFNVNSVDLTLAKWSTATGVDGDHVTADAGFAPCGSRKLIPAIRPLSEARRQKRPSSRGDVRQASFSVIDDHEISR